MTFYVSKNCGQIAAALVVFALACPEAAAQSKVDPPTTVRGTGVTMAPNLVRNCLFLAKEISELTDRARVAEGRGDIATFNATIDLYNGATSRWNAGCTTAYNPADMIRAENDAGVRLCEFTSFPCLSDAERVAILDGERRNQAAAGAQLGMQRTTGTIRAAAAAAVPDSNSDPWAVVRVEPASCAHPNGQAEHAACAADALAVETDLINTKYNALRTTLDADTFAKLRSVQLLWISYKDAACDLEASVRRGDVPQQTLRDQCLARLTGIRREELQPFEN